MGEKTDQERIEQLEATVAHLLGFLGPIADAIMTTHRRLLALEGVLEVKCVVTEEDLAAKMQAIDDAATLEIEYASEHEEFRRLRQFLKQQTENQETNQE